ncbi:hypothetical protein AQJ66_24320 [Streptomyces bungoensis]|uniref:Uncharacterized protein n=1 Tax=Streptomyces bungoensis TaxID=285568 RepID=A0A101SVR4_9ACTN|nr:hypothetical protein [Streptomyces bungoensis]KUN81099.1 hypothetical protein AQJ66_24320 [Streptomyces bungoensis]
MIALTDVAAFITCYVGLARIPQPHQLPSAVVGSRLSMKTQHVLGDSVAVHLEPTISSADRALQHRDVAAGLTRSGTSTLSLDVASANGLSATNALEGFVSAYAHGAAKDVTVQDAVPLTHRDSRGLAGLNVAFGVSLCGFVLAESLPALSRRLHIRHRFALMRGFAVATGVGRGRLGRAGAGSGARSPLFSPGGVTRQVRAGMRSRIAANTAPTAACATS